MTVVQFEERAYELADGESVLDVLLRYGTDFPHSCRAGLCQSCLIQVAQGEAPAAAQAGLSEQQKAMGYVLSCLCKPPQDLSLRRVSQAGLTRPACVIAKDWLSPEVLRLRLMVDCEFRGGQYVTLGNQDGLGRCYSIASIPEEGFVECHVRVYPDGQFSQFLAQQLSVGEVLSVRGPLGTCFYTCSAEQAEQPLLLLGVGTGIAPLLGVIKTALAAGHRGDIHVVFAARQASELYALAELEAMASSAASLKVHAVALQGEASPELQIGDVYEYVQATWPSLKGVRVFLCGAESFVRKMKKQCFLAGASMREIHADAFVMAGA